MGIGGRVIRGGPVGALALAVLGLGCRSGPAPSERDAPPSALSPPGAAASGEAPSDHLAQDELVEGSEVALGVKLPRDLKLEQAFSDLAYARGFASVHSLTTYFRARLRDGSLREGESSATFEHVHTQARPDRELTVRIGTAPGGARIELRDTTQRPSSSLPNDEARLRQVGITPEGRWVDPAHLN
jgi:hypothetical protein